ncbi:piggyBac transposable element-derived protein 2-like [Ischnura elegans]|uniref:piggyBac transposable element-derived protein 2-like n=1 Tax=Ischnura elegans TaxID=197161 RepID=UPI001ED893CB|nr:piggyBac transposable element-derived protein 2-like [Ischnura elegans]
MLGDSDVDIPGEISSGEDEEHDFNEYLEEYSSEDDVPLASLRSPNSEKGTPKNKKWTRDKMPPYVHDVEDLFCENEEGSQNFLDMFFEYFPPSFWKSVVEQSNLYSVQVRDHRSINMTYDEIIRFVGVSILMGSLNYPQTRLYWSRDLAVPLIQKVMSRDRFFELRNHLHFVDKFVTSDSDDKLQKVRPILDAFLKKCHMLPRSNEQSVDEQMISFTGRCPNRQYVPNKPHPVGLKNFVLAERDGLVLDFHIYVGKGTIPDKDMRELGLGAGIVKLLTRTISHSIIYCDRFFTSEKLGDYLVANNFNLCGTVMKNRVGGALSILKSDKELKRGDYDEVLRSDKKCVVIGTRFKLPSFTSTRDMTGNKQRDSRNEASRASRWLERSARRVGAKGKRGRPPRKEGSSSSWRLRSRSQQEATRLCVWAFAITSGVKRCIPRLKTFRLAPVSTPRLQMFPNLTVRTETFYVPPPTI